ncbi:MULTISPECIES: DUF4075 domain-containing protein [Bacillus]|uniref:DUF4075 domain-containing protein n=1 Tax=Bacillus pseudomycoides TaxID=64104 RepID=A0AAJ1Z8D9_9BACI|nr:MULTISPECIES: DUF4075 domain-containing protein [Bacillus]EEM12828.1 Mature parasite-infected erythrocyte surface antigen [Bacillus pseudomycoides]KFN13731.1 hypothetical protein DJ94_1502 [Bacillus pseudomycoides]MBD5799210.1 hypothetical protein [Bacillus pseudomycoides]MCR8859069.1 DUF4075 domain-containing protein [Bacillus pseudomycoides]MCX2827816.1 DUF4075 domain-containing protein [Bacillus sp. DHT2]
MAKKNNIARNIAIGVAAGVAVSMLKKENREKVKNTAEKAKSKMIEIGENAKIKEKVQTVTDKGRELADFNVVKAKVAEIKKLTPAVVGTLKETKEIFSKKKIEREEKPETIEIQAVSPKVEEEPVVAEDGGMKEARELFMKDSNAEEKKTEAYIELKQDKEEKKSV